MAEENTPGKEGQRKSQLAQVNAALGVFMLSFGAIVVLAVFFTETTAGKITNAVAGLILCSIGAAFILRARKG